jgi:2-haloacid dehalogenase
MTHSYRLVTFDVYTAIFDVEGSLVPALTGRLGAGVDGLALVRTWRSKQLEYALINNSLQRGRMSFRLVTGHALDYTLGRARLSLPDEARNELLAAWDHLQPWPEAGEMLAAVRSRGYPIGALSNGDESMLRALLVHLPVVFDHVFAADQAGYYKPHPSVYALPLKALGLAADQVLHVAGSPTDVMGARSAGLRCAWSNRHGDRVLDPAYRADYESADLRGLLEIL